MGVKPVVMVVTVATAGNAIAVISASTQVTAVYFEGFEGNTGKIYVGTSTVTTSTYAAKLIAGGGFSLTADNQGRAGSSAGGGEIALNTIFVNAGTSGDKCMVTYLERVGSF